MCLQYKQYIRTPQREKGHTISRSSANSASSVRPSLARRRKKFILIGCIFGDDIYSGRVVAAQTAQKFMFCVVWLRYHMLSECRFRIPSKCNEQWQYIRGVSRWGVVPCRYWYVHMLQFTVEVIHSSKRLSVIEYILLLRNHEIAIRIIRVVYRVWSVRPEHILALILRFPKNPSISVNSCA